MGQRLDIAKRDRITVQGEHMQKKTSQRLMSAAIAGMIGAGGLALQAANAHAGDAGMKGHCVGANSCKGKSGCAQASQNECAGKNACKGKGFLEKTKAQCDKMSMKNKKVHFEAMEEKKTDSPQS
jgi:hypothetical protein